MKAYKAIFKPKGMRAFPVLICAENLADAKTIARKELTREGTEYVTSPYTNYNRAKDVKLGRVVSFKDRTKACSRLEPNKAHYTSRNAFDGARRARAKR